MKNIRKLIVTITVGWLMISESALSDYRKVYGSIHDLSTLRDARDGQSVCLYCHSKHSEQSQPPLWDSSSDSSLMLYSANNPNSSLGNSTAICLSCHDGTIGSDVRKSRTGTFVDNPNQWSQNDLVFTATAFNQDHPVGIEVPVDSRGYRDIASINASGLRLFDNKVECATCHAVHGGFESKGFLRLDPSNSGLCLGCHLK